MGTGTSSGVSPQERFREWMGLLNDLRGTTYLLNWDQETVMPPAGAQGRGRMLAGLATLRHRELVRPEIGEAIDELDQNGELGADERAAIRLARWERRRAERLPEGLVRELSEATSNGVTVWLDARPRDDFPAYARALERVIAAKRRAAEAMEIGNEPYDALLDRFEPGARVADLEPFFDDLERCVRPLVERAAGEKAPSTFADRRWDEGAQMALSHDVARLVGFDLEGGLIGRSAHPFTEGFHRGDVRFTTRFQDDDPASGILTTLHEAGHALYSQGHGVDLEGTLLAWSPSLGAEESQSRFWENHLGRRLAFWRLLQPDLERRFPGAMKGLLPEHFHERVNRVSPGWCRTEADEVTYDLHIVLRFRLELALLRGDLRVEDLPGAWRDGMERLLGVRPESDATGVMQDIHWPWGLVGYFPTYTLGNVWAAQLAEALAEEHGSLDDLLAAGELGTILSFMRERVHVHGSRYETPELMRRATGRPFRADELVAHLERVATGGE